MALRFFLLCVCTQNSLRGGKNYIFGGEKNIKNVHFSHGCARRSPLRRLALPSASSSALTPAFRRAAAAVAIQEEEEEVEAGAEVVEAAAAVAGPTRAYRG